MKKMLFLAVTLLLSTAIYAQSDELLGFVPADIDGFACLNFKELASHPKIREAIEKNDDQQFMKFKDELKTNGIDIFNSCTNGIIFFNASSKKGGAVIKTGVNEDTFNKISASSLADGSMKKTVLAGKVLYVFEKGSERTALTYLKPDIVGISDQPEETVKLASLEKSSGVSSNEKLMGLSSKADRKSAAWAVFATKIDPPKAGGQDPMQQMIPIDNIQGGIFSLNFTGETKDTANLKLNLNCKEKAKAQILTIQLQAMVLALIPSIAQGNPQLSDEFMKALKFTNQENDIIINADVSPALQEELKKFAEANAANALSGQFAPPTMKKEKEDRQPPATEGPGIPPQPKVQQ